MLPIRLLPAQFLSFTPGLTQRLYQRQHIRGGITQAALTVIEIDGCAPIAPVALDRSELLGFHMRACLGLATRTGSF